MLASQILELIRNPSVMDPEHNPGYPRVFPEWKPLSPTSWSLQFTGLMVLFCLLSIIAFAWIVFSSDLFAVIGRHITAQPTQGEPCQSGSSLV